MLERGEVGRAAPAVCAVLGLGLVLVVSGVSLGECLRYFAYYGGLVVLPGTILWRAVRPRRRLALADWACGAALGYSLEIAAYVVARAVGHPGWWVAAPVLVLVGAVFVKRHRGAARAADSRGGDQGAAPRWALVAVALYLGVWWLLTMFEGHPLGSDVIVDPDEYFHLALVGEIAHRFPWTYPYVTDAGRLTYQWFVHAHMAAAGWATGLESQLLYRRFEPLTMSVVATLGYASAAVSISRRLWVGPLTAALLVLVGSFDITGTLAGQAVLEERFLQGPILMHSPTMTLAYVLTPPLLVLLVDLLGQPAGRRRTWAGVAFLAVALSGAKVTVLPMLAAGLLLTTGVLAARRQPSWRPALGAAAVLVAVIGLSGVIIYRGADQPLSLEPLSITRHYMVKYGISGGGGFGQGLVTASLLVSWGASGIGIVGLWSRRFAWHPAVWLFVGAVLAGFVAMFGLAHAGLSQQYFGRSTAPLVAILSAWGVVELLARGSDRVTMRLLSLAALAGGLVLVLVRRFTESWKVVDQATGQELPVLRLWVNLPAFIVLVLILVLLATLARDFSPQKLRIPVAPLVVAFILGTGLARTLAFSVGHHVAFGAAPDRYRIGGDGMAAAAFVRATSSPDDVVATNAHCGPAQRLPDVCDNRHFWLSALTERRVVVEGWAYTGVSPQTWEDGRYWNPSVLARNDELFERPTPARLAATIESHGTRWLVVDRRLNPDERALEGLEGLRKLWEQGNFAVYLVEATRP